LMEPTVSIHQSTTGLHSVGKATTCSPDTVSASSFLDTLSAATASPGGIAGLSAPMAMPQWIKGALSPSERLQYRGCSGSSLQRRQHRQTKGMAPLLGKSPLAAPLSRSSAGSNKALRSPSPQRRRAKPTQKEGAWVRESRSAGDIVTRVAVGKGSHQRWRQNAKRRDGPHQQSTNRTRNG
jgi:hypothetical protein